MRGPPTKRLRKRAFEQLYATYNCRRWVHPDPLEHLYPYEDMLDREAAGLIASGLAYGRVAQILKSVASVLERMGPSPCAFLRGATPSHLTRVFRGFKHRFTTAEELVALCMGVKEVTDRYGSLYACFLCGLREEDETVLPALAFLVDELSFFCRGRANSLLPLPGRGSACKRLHLFLRWMVREDAVDPGGWSGVSPAKLVVPLDTHMQRICGQLGLTRRKHANIHTSLEITRAFRKVAPEDPVRYDFALTRLGIRSDADPDAFLRTCAGP